MDQKGYEKYFVEKKMGKDPYEFLYEQRKTCLENQSKIWDSIDTKLSLMITQAFLFIGFSLSVLQGCELLLMLPIVISIIIYLIGIWPQKYVVLPSPNMIADLNDYLTKNPRTDIKTVYRSISCKYNNDDLKKLNENMTFNNKIIENKSILFKTGLVINIIGAVLIIYYIIIK